MVSAFGPVDSGPWQPAPPHPREKERVASLREYDLFGCHADPAFDRVAALAKRMLDVPTALVVLLEVDHVFCKSHVGWPDHLHTREESLCPYAILSPEPLVLPDLQKDPFYCTSPALLKYGIRFYVGVPLLDDEGLPLGTFCLISNEPKVPSEEWLATAVDFAQIIRDEMALQRSNRKVLDAIAEVERSQRRYTSLVATVPGVVFLLTMTLGGQPRFTFLSDGIRELCGIEPDEFMVLHDSGGTMIHPEDQDRFVDAFRASAKSNEPFEWQGRMSSFCSGARWIQAVARPERAEDGELVWSGIITDIGALKSAEAEIREMNHTLETKVLQRTDDLHKAQVEMLSRLGRAAEARDDDTGAHIARVARTSGILAEGIGMSAEDCEMIQQASPMHDIGKISIPDAVLLKKGRLDPDEMATMRRHAVEGARMLEGGTTPLVQMAETIARTHHERWDGSGYPHGLAGQEIPLVGRIVAIADVFDALTSKRPYKRAWTVEEAVEEIRRGAGTQFDPRLVRIFETFLDVIVDGLHKIELPAAA